jgi:Flp pilus assembly protein TadG
MLGRIGRLRSIGAAFARAKEGTSAILLALVLPTLAGIAGFSADYSAASSGQQRLQGVVDSAALAIAREMTVTPVDNVRAQALAEQYIAANIPANTPYKIVVAAALAEGNTAVKVNGQQQVATPFGLLERFAGVSIISATALARVTAASAPQKVCMVSLGEKIDGGIYMHNGSVITAPGCVLYSNSTNKDSIILNAGSSLKTSVLCSRGGVKNMASLVDAAIVTDCPSMTDPLATKPEPVMPATCVTGPKKISAGVKTLNPGTYCKGLEIDGTAKVTLNPGVYFFKDGPLRVSQTAELSGNGVTLMFTGKKSYFRFLDKSLIQLTAPSSGPTAGMLLWESQLVPGVAAWWNNGCGGNNSEDDDDNGGACTPPGSYVKAKKTNEHHINSDRARLLTGTIYLKKGLLLIDSTKPIADLSPYTIMVVQKLDLFDGPNLMLNSNYSGSAVPVPAGLGITGATKIRIGM